MEIPILKDVVIILGLSVVILLLFQRLKLPSILGFLLTGIVAGPYALNLVESKHEVEMMSEIGIIFLLFVIGIEFSLKGLSTIKQKVLIGGGIQVFGTIGAIAGVSIAIGFQTTEAVFLGFLFALSSTAIVLKMMQERGEITTPHGRMSVAILIFQDLIVVPMLLFVPIMSGNTENLGETLLWLGLKVAIVIGLIVVMAKYAIPKLLELVVRTKSTELFILTIIMICFATSFLTHEVGLSLALGAFFAGLIISESEYSHQATANILPFREIFISFFFVSIGMLLNIRFFIDNIVTIHLLAILASLVKFIIIGIAVLLLKYPARTAFYSGAALFQVGEFAFLLSATGMNYDLMSQETYQYFLAVSIITMGATPFVVNLAPKAWDLLVKSPIPTGQGFGKAVDDATLDELEALSDHILVIGYGVNGQNVAKAAAQADISRLVIDLDVKALNSAKKHGHLTLYGDACDPVILKHAKVYEARVIVVAVSDSATTKKIIQTVRQFTPTAYVIARTRYVKDIDAYIKVGADDVIPEEFETSIEIFTRVLKKYLVPYSEIQNFTQYIRSKNYDILRNVARNTPLPRNIGIHIPEMEIATLHVMRGENRVVGKTLKESNIRREFGVTVLAIKRGEQFISEIYPEIKILTDDILYLFGHPDEISNLNKCFKL